MLQPKLFRKFPILWNTLIEELLDFGVITGTEKWQGSPTNGREFLELRQVSFAFSLPSTSSSYLYWDIDEIGADKIWADKHFEERVSGLPVNPGETYKLWPYYRNNPNNDKFRENEQFSHTYMERYWPKLAGEAWNSTGILSRAEELFGSHLGIRYHYGDLNDLIDLLKKEPFTRQAYLPVWFPEDTGVVHGGRVPCSIGYHFMVREGGIMYCHYFLRSCDLIRHFRDDMYLTLRLMEHVNKKAQLECSSLVLNVSISSLHIFKEEKNLLPKLKLN